VAGMKPAWRIGVDRESRKWLVKMTGSFYGYREHVFASLAQRLGLSCQSSTYLLIDQNNKNIHRESGNAERFQLAVWLMDEHARQPCSPTCPFQEAYGKQVDFQSIMRARDSGLTHFDDLIRGEILGHLCGQLEPHGDFITSDHEYVMIDNECMFHDDKPCLSACEWNGKKTRPIVIGVCKSLVNVHEDELRSIATVPDGYTVTKGRNLYDDLCAAKTAANEYIERYTK
jgi:hypothetical protein